MDVTTMAKTNSLARKLKSDFPEIRFEKSDDFYWSPTTKTVFVSELSTEEDELTLLHEVAHAVLNHQEYSRDIELLKIERQAWDYVKTKLASKYGVTYDEDHAETMIDSYRDWLHERSTCSHCLASGIQISDHTYRCLGCSYQWRVNDARRCGLKRYALNTTK